jgi:hypothetical protein
MYLRPNLILYYWISVMTIRPLISAYAQSSISHCALTYELFLVCLTEQASIKFAYGHEMESSFQFGTEHNR